MGVKIKKIFMLECDICKTHLRINDEYSFDYIQINGGKYQVCVRCYNNVRDYIYKIKESKNESN